MNPHIPQPDPGQLAEALGVPLFTTDFYLPQYKEGRAGKWKLARSPFGLVPGYYTKLWAASDMPVLLRSAGGDSPSWETWMSLSPREIESQELACRFARGYTVVMGLGMGWVAANIALNPAVDRVTVVEYDPQVIALIEESGALDQLPPDILAKLDIVQADALAWTPAEAVDFLYADIWLTLDEPETLGEVGRMQENIHASTIYYWGQELTIHAQAKKLAEPGQELTLTEPLIRRIVTQEIGLPLLIPDDEDYAGMIEKVVQLRGANAE